MLGDEVDLSEMLGIEEEPEPALAPGAKYDTRRKKVVCKHWLRGLCKKSDEACDFLHRLDRDRMPECWCAGPAPRVRCRGTPGGIARPMAQPAFALHRYFTNYGECHSRDCVFKHTRPEDKVDECPWYARGFCKHGPRCRFRHTRKKACVAYLAGFCPEGKACQFGHPKNELPPIPRGDTCVPVGVPPPRASGVPGGFAGGFGSRDLSNVTCFKCWQKGHYANSCPNARVAPPDAEAEAIQASLQRRGEGGGGEGGNAFGGEGGLSQATQMAIQAAQLGLGGTGGAVGGGSQQRMGVMGMGGYGAQGSW